jgi:hypothetical protein
MKRISIFGFLFMVGLAACSSATFAPATEAPTITPATPTPAPLTITVEELVGSWKDVDGYIEFKPDGTWAFATTLDALKAGTLYVEGTFRIEGNEITVLDDICGNRVGVYRLETKTENKLTFTQVKEECIGQRRLPFLDRILLDTPAPTSESTNTSVPVSQFQSFPKVGCCRGKTIEQGEYELPSWLGIPLTLEVGDGWRVLNEKAALLFLLAGQGRNSLGDPSQVLVFIAVPDEDPQELLTSIKNSPELTFAGEISEVSIAGFAGLQVDASAKPNPGNEGNRGDGISPGSQFLPAVNKYFTEGFLWTTWTAEPRLRFMVLNVGEHVLLIEIESPPAEFEAFSSEADKVLQTLKLRR